MTLTSKLAAALVLLLLLVSSGWYVYNAGNRNGTNAALVKTQSETISIKDHEISALAQANIENEAKALGYAAAAKEASKDHENELLAVRSAADRSAGQRVQIDPAQFCDQFASGAESIAAGRDGQAAARSAFLPDWFATELRQAAAKADEVTADLRHLVRRAEEAACFM